MDNETSMDAVRRARRALRWALPLIAAAFAAVMCAGPLGGLSPTVLRWFEGPACPGDQHLEVIEVLALDVSPVETRQLVYCVDDQGQGTLAGARPFLVMLAVFLPMFTLAAFGGVAAAERLGRWFFGRPRQPLGWEGEREARALLAQGRRAAAEQLVRAKTGSGPRWARQYVETLARQPEK
jgi:hypothetical protein